MTSSHNLEALLTYGEGHLLKFVQYCLKHLLVFGAHFIL